MLRLSLRFLLTGLRRRFLVGHLLQIDKNRLFWRWRVLRQVIQQRARSHMQQKRQDQQKEK
jgi:hypothetical protein